MSANSIVKPEMQGLKQIARIRQYCDYVERHLNNVAKAWEILQKTLIHEKEIWDDFCFWSIHHLIEFHDISKMDAEEFIPYCEWFYHPYGKECDSFNTKGENEHTQLQDAFKKAWEHHKEKNPHHWQNWTRLKKRSHPYEDGWHLVCMVADWMAMGMEFGDTAEEYYSRNKDNIILPDWAEEFLQQIFLCLKKVKK